MPRRTFLSICLLIGECYSKIQSQLLINARVYKTSTICTTVIEGTKATPLPTFCATRDKSRGYDNNMKSFYRKLNLRTVPKLEAGLNCSSNKLSQKRRSRQTLRNNMLQPTPIDTEKQYLPEDYTPSDTMDVICGRGTECFRHKGNVAFRSIIDTKIDQYCAARSKLEKSITVVQVVDAVRSQSGPHGKPIKFVRWDQKLHLWYEIGDDAARKSKPAPFAFILFAQTHILMTISFSCKGQKVGQTIRDYLIHRDPQKRASKAKMRASNKAKRLATKSPPPGSVTSLTSSLKDHLSILPADAAIAVSKNEETDKTDGILSKQTPLIDNMMTTAPAPPAPPGRTKSAPVASSSTWDFTDVEKMSPPRRTKSDVISLADAALAAIPPSLDSMTSRDWFTHSVLHREDSDVPDIDTVFEDGGSV